MSQIYHPNSHYQHKVDVWQRLFAGYYHMDTELVEIITRAVVSVGILGLIFTGDVSGAFGVFAVTVIMGIDLAAAFEAFRKSQTDQNRDATYHDE